MAQSIRELCLLAVIFGLLLRIMPENGAKRAAMLAIEAAFAIIVLSAITQFDYAAYARQLAVFREYDKSLSQESEEVSVRLNRFVIEDECEAYILKRASEIRADITDATVTVHLSEDGIWIPYSVNIYGKEDKMLAEYISAELGIAPEKIGWCDGE